MATGYGQLDDCLSDLRSLSTRDDLFNLSNDFGSFHLASRVPNLPTVPEQQPCDVYIEGCAYSAIQRKFTNNMIDYLFLWIRRCRNCYSSESVLMRR